MELRDENINIDVKFDKFLNSGELSKYKSRSKNEKRKVLHSVFTIILCFD